MNNLLININPLVWYLIIVALLIFIFTVLKSKTTFLDVNRFENLGEDSVIITKTRLLGFFLIAAIPIIDFIETELKGIYTTNWMANILIMILAALVLLYSYKSNINIQKLRQGVLIVYFLTTILEMHRLYNNGFNSSLSIEVCLCILFSIIIIDQIKVIYAYIVMVVALSIIGISLSNVNVDLKVVYVSCIIQSLVIILIFVIVEQKKIYKLLFMQKIINEIPLLILVLNAEGEVVFLNPALANLLNYKVDDLLGVGLWRKSSLNEEEILGYKLLIKSKIESVIEEDYTNDMKDKEGNTHTISWKSKVFEKNKMLSFGTLIQTKLKEV